MNILYSGVDNPISFSANGYNSKDLIIRVDCGELKKVEGNYIWRLCRQTKTRAKFSVFYSHNNKIKLVGTSDFRIKEIPNPILKFGVTNGDIIRHPTPLTMFWGIRVDLENFDFDVRFHVRYYEVEFIKISGDTIKISNYGPAFNSTVKLEIEKMKIGDKICVKNVIVFTDCDILDRNLADKACIEKFDE
jgi:hypothetical protein